MTSDEAKPPAPASVPADLDKNQPGTLCGRCDHLNLLGQEECEECGAPLFIACPHCGERNPRVFSRCQHCRHRLRRRGLHLHRKHRGHRRKARSSADRATRQMIWVLGVILFLFAVAAVILQRLKG